jgi:hypothetical protein
MLYCSYFNCMTIFKFLLTAYMQYNFYTHMGRVTSSHFVKYFCDIYSEFITLCTLMIYATFDTIRVMPPRLRTLRSEATVWSD